MTSDLHRTVGRTFRTYRSANSNRKASSPRPTTHETHTVASQKQLEGTRVTRKGDSNSRSLHPVQWWLLEDNVLTGQPLHPLKHALQIFTDASKEGWCAHLNERTARGSWSLPESKLHINYLELKAVFLVLKEFQDLCTYKIVLVATDNTTVVSYINKEGGMRPGPHCALLWRILTWCTSHQVTLRARHIPGRLNVVADKLSRLGQTIQTEWSLLQEVFQSICSRWHRPNIDLFATRFNNKLPQLRFSAHRGDVFFVNNKRNPVWYISLGEYKELSIYIARKLNNIHNMCNLCSYYQCCSLYLHVY